MPSKSDINPNTGLPYAINPQTGIWDDNYFANVVEPQLKGLASTGNPVLDVINRSINEHERRFNEYQQKYNEFETNNPFIFDKVLAEEKTKVGQRLDPYYTQTLNDYVQGVTTKRTRSLEDERTLLSELTLDADRATGRAKLQIQDALERSREGFADAGLYDSGKRLREEGKLAIEGEENLADLAQNTQRQTKRITQSRSRLFEDLDIEERQRKRDLEQEKQYNIESQALGEVGRRQSTREFERGQFTGPEPTANPQLWQSYLYSQLQ